MKKVLLVATVQSHIGQFHRPLAEVLHQHGYEVHVAARNNLAEKNGLKLDFADKVFDVPFSRSPKSKDNLSAYKDLKKIQRQVKLIRVHLPSIWNYLINFQLLSESLSKHYFFKLSTSF